jgi:hypothetical protein
LTWKLLGKAWNGSGIERITAALSAPFTRYLDGGGVRGLSSLLIIKELMKKIKDGDDPIPRPCQYFDMIAGTSTGG